MIRTILLGLALLAAPEVQAQTPFSFTTNGRPATTGDDVSLAQMVAQGAAKQDLTINLGPGFGGTAAQFLTGTRPITGLNVTGQQSLNVVPTGNEAPTLASVNIQGTTAASMTRQFMVTLGMTANQGGACTGPQCGAVTLYTAMRQVAGASDAWGQNILVRGDAGVDKYLQALEVDVDNWRGDTPLGRGNFIGGITLTGTSAQDGYLNRHAYMVSSGSPWRLWHVGLLGDANAMGGPSVKEALIYDQGAGGTFSYWNQSAHAGATFFDQGTAPVSMALSGTYSRAAVATENATTPMALSAAAGQKVCFASGHACAWFDATAGKWMFSDDNDVVVFSVARTTGNAVFKGTVTASGTP